MGVTVSEVILLKCPLSELLSIFHPGSVLLFCDNKVDIQISSNSIFYDPTKRVEIDYHIVSEKISTSIVKTQHVRTTDQVADLFMKALGGQQHVYLMSKKRLKDIYGAVRLMGSAEDQ